MNVTATENISMNMDITTSCCSLKETSQYHCSLSSSQTTTTKPTYSILNVVIDYVMTQPTPFEWQEFDQKMMSNNNIVTRVPVIRVFGPLVKHHNNKGNTAPKQNGCVHIHNVFPYLLARPSERRFSKDQKASSIMDTTTTMEDQEEQEEDEKEALDIFLGTVSRINWDDYDSIDRSLQELKYYLEQSCADVVSARKMIAPQHHSNQKQNTPSYQTTQVIRDITVCSGRAFYTYDPDPPSFFLKIEYYNPRDRPMIRALLQQNNNDPKKTKKTTKFHCFEAHIPYTMQFFKDYNLAGLKYIHLAEKEDEDPDKKLLLFRTPLPTSMHPDGEDLREKNATSVMSENKNWYILEENTPPDLVWDAFLLQQDDDWLKKNFRPPVKVTACNKLVELDIDASAILNVKQIVTLPEDITATQKLDELQNVHWRAVPSLREIWEEEKARMEILLKDFPEENFLKEQKFQKKKNKPKDNVVCLAQTEAAQQKQRQRMPGTKEAIKGMYSLFGIDGTSDDITLQHNSENNNNLFFLYRRAMQGIIERHQTAVEDEEKKWKERYLPTSASAPSPSTSSPHLSLSDNSFLENLGALQDQFISPEQFTATQPQYSDEGASSTSTKRNHTSRNNNSILSEFTPPSQELFSSSSAFKKRQKTTRQSGIQFTPHVTKRLSEDTLRRTQTQIAEEIRLDALGCWEDVSEGEDHEELDANEQTEQSLVLELLSLEDERVDPSKSTQVSQKSDVRKGTILELNRILPSTSEVILQSSTKSEELYLGYCGEFDRLKEYFGGVVHENRGRSWWEPACEPPDPKDVYRQCITKRMEASCQGVDHLNHSSKAESDKHQKDSSGLKSSVPISTGKKAEGSKLQTPLYVMSIEIHVQCRIGKTGYAGIKELALTPNPERDAIFAIVYALGKDPGDGKKIEITNQGCLFVPVQVESCKSCTPILLGEHIYMERVQSERSLLHRFASIVGERDPDILISWDTHGSGIGYLIQRGVALGKNVDRNGQEKGCSPIDMVRLLGRTPALIEEIVPADDSFTQSINGYGDDGNWKGSGLGAEWDDLKGSGAAASSIVGRLVWCGWKITSEEVQHPMASSQNAMVSTVLHKRLPDINSITLNRWYGAEDGHQRFRVLQYRLNQAVATLFIIDELDIIGRTGETARLSGIEFSQSLPGIRGSQYKVEGVLLRALQSVSSDERGFKKGQNKNTFSGQSSSFSDRSDSQAPSPWKLRRNFARNAAAARPGNESLTPASQQVDSSSCSKDDIQNRGYYFFSLGKEDKDNLEPLRVQALTLEPKSGFYEDPVIVCDFTALYPSLVIAYNLCYSTCAGQIDYTSIIDETKREGVTSGRIGPFLYPEQLTATVLKQHYKSLNQTGGTMSIREDRAYIAPNGAIFVGESVLKGVLPQVLGELLSTRAMLKRAAKIYKAHGVEPAILRQLEARQLALKYVANVTYGYTSATFSGRCSMPVLADAIVECARRTLTNAIKIAEKWGKEKFGKWEGAEVLYGDTDSVFIKLPGRTVEEAFLFGKEYCESVTFSNPPPVELKLEKVYKGTLLQTKKRYCGMKFESPMQQPELESKGLETIRKDQCQLTKKILSRALITAFEQGKQALKSYLERQWSNIYAGKLPVSDFILTGRVRSKYRNGADKSPPAAAALARRLAESDPGFVIREKERVSYVVVASPGRNVRLSDCVVTPMELLEQWDSYRINVEYYITKQLNAALQRCFSLPPFFQDIHQWYEAIAKPRKRIQYWPSSSSGVTSMITTYFGSDVCTLCNRKCKMAGRSKLVVCTSCKGDKMRTSLNAIERCLAAQTKAHELAKICKACNGCPETADSFAVEVVTGFGKAARIVATPLANCVCTDCPITFERHRAKENCIFADELCKALNLSW